MSTLGNDSIYEFIPSKGNQLYAKFMLGLCAGAPLLVLYWFFTSPEHNAYWAGIGFAIVMAMGFSGMVKSDGPIKKITITPKYVELFTRSSSRRIAFTEMKYCKDRILFTKGVTTHYLDIKLNNVVTPPWFKPVICYRDRIMIFSSIFSYDQYNKIRSLIGGHVKSSEEDDGKPMQYAGPNTYRHIAPEQTESNLKNSTQEQDIF